MTTIIDLSVAEIPGSNAASQTPNGVADAGVAPRFEIAPAPGDRIRRLAERFGVDVLQDVELLELQLARSYPEGASKLAAKLIGRFGGLVPALAADPRLLAEDISQAAILDLKILRQAVIRVAACGLSKRELLTAFGAVCEYLKALMRGLPREEFWVLFLDRRNQLLSAERLGQGSVDHAPVYPREVLRRALELNCSAMILAHNHPTGDPEPSRADIEMTKQIASIARMMQISVHDHIIVGADKVASLKSLGLL